MPFGREIELTAAQPVVLIPLNSGHDFRLTICFYKNPYIGLNPFEFRACLSAHTQKDHEPKPSLNPFEFRACLSAHMDALLRDDARLNPFEFRACLSALR